MSEVVIPIDTFNPVEFFGVNDSNLEVIRKNFPELKLVARGNEIKVIGDEKNIHVFIYFVPKKKAWEKHMSKGLPMQSKN